MNQKQKLIDTMRAFVAQRPGLDFANYGERSDYRRILKAGRDARELLRAVELRDSITAQHLIEASERAFMGRLTFKTRDDGTVAIDYCTGQYWPTEYRNAACSVLAYALWGYWRANMPKPTKAKDGADLYDGMCAGDWLRRKAREEFGRSIAQAWFS